MLSKALFAFFASIAVVSAGDGCTGDDDRSALNAPEFPPQLLSCSKRNLGDRSKTIDCLRSQQFAEKTLSETCLGCFGDTVACGAKNCRICVINQCSDSCIACTRSKCAPSLYECTGLDVETCPDPCKQKKKLLRRPIGESDDSDVVLA
mmetsp:Transcript_53042/g.103776  ORF Transcript_53042/g.103776 Transcript_53042/m.103776 type:complete len:149 (-) Transcript_53042:755-1201(-)